jgi:dihydroorotase
MKIIISNGRIIDPANGRDEIADLVIIDGVIGADDRDERRAEIIDATGLIVAPGLIDIHVHLREPGSAGRKQSRPAHVRRPQADSPRSSACRTRRP